MLCRNRIFQRSGARSELGGVPASGPGRLAPVQRRGTVLQGPGCLNYSWCSSSTPGHPGDHPRRQPSHHGASKGGVGRPSAPARGNPGLHGFDHRWVEVFRQRATAQTPRAAFSRDIPVALRTQLDGLLLEFAFAPARLPAGRPHNRFLMNLEVAAPSIKDALLEAWAAHAPWLRRRTASA